MSFRRLVMTLSILLVVRLPWMYSQEPTSVRPVASVSNVEVDFPALVRETQQLANAPGYVGLVWWIPTQYWVISAERAGTARDKAEARYAPLSKYTVVAVAAGKIGIGNVNWFSEPEIRDNVLLRDAAGHSYRPVEKLSGDAQGLVSIMKPVFANLMGPTGQNLQLLFFSGTDQMATPIADPLRTGDFTVVVTNLIGGKDSSFDWRLPLTSLSPPKYCPIGKERLEANWKYCPWHGVKLSDESANAIRK